MTDYTRIRNYVRIPLALYDMELSSSAVMMYGLLLLRCTLSQKNGQVDENGEAYAFYPIEKLAADLNRNRSTAERLLDELKKKGLIVCRSTGKGKANRIYVILPPEKTCPENEHASHPENEYPSHPENEYRPTSEMRYNPPQKQAPNNIYNKDIYNNTYNNNKRMGGKRNTYGENTGSGMFAPIPDYEKSGFGYGY